MKKSKKKGLDMDIFNRINNYASEKGIPFEEAALKMIMEGVLHPRDLNLLHDGVVDNDFHQKAWEAYQEYERRRWEIHQADEDFRLLPA